MRVEVSISQQLLTLYKGTKIVKTYSISTAEKGAGNQKNSNQTPLGNHIVRAKIGKGDAINTVFVGRRKTGEIYSTKLAKQNPNRDWVLTRIIWLSGTEKGKNRLQNVDSMQRYIYIHGTPDTEPMGVPASHGCIRMNNLELVELFDLIEVQAAINIKV